MRHLLTAGVLALSFGTRELDGQNSALTPFGAAKAESILRHQLPCLGCHTLQNEGGRIGPDLTSVRERRSTAYIAAMIADPQRVVPGSAMPRMPMPEATRDLIVRFLDELPATAPAPDAAAPTPAAPAAAATDGSALYARWCASCHGAGGKGDGPNASFLPVKPAQHASRQAMEVRSDDALYDTIHGGGAIMNRSARMPAFGATLTDPEIRALIAHIRSLCNCRGPEWSRDGTR
ncbi:MAG: hypothetical protein MNPFHGCM_02475 [Gemmatimonadaceae bacterium]|nr:hypothetical protein [Gemmatimonadaceae bacterium]